MWPSVSTAFNVRGYFAALVSREGAAVELASGVLVVALVAGVIVALVTGASREQATMPVGIENAETVTTNGRLSGFFFIGRNRRSL